MPHVFILVQFSLINLFAYANVFTKRRGTVMSCVACVKIVLYRQVSGAIFILVTL